MSQMRATPVKTWELEEVPCDYCGSADADVLYSARSHECCPPGFFNLVVCRECGLVRTSPRPTLESLPAAYPSSYPPHQRARREARSPRGPLRWVLVNYRNYPISRPASLFTRTLLLPLAALILGRRRFLRYVPREGKGRLLDFGCGSGSYVARMMAAGWEAEGLDLSSNAVAVGREAGLTIHEGTLPGAEFPDGHYDAITMWHSLEHVPSPKATLKAIHDLLRPGGLLLVACPRFDSLAANWFKSNWGGLRLPGHLTHFSRGSLKRHLQAAGFEVTRFYSWGSKTDIRLSFTRLSNETGNSFHRRLARSRLVARLLSYAALVTRRTSRMVWLARKRPSPGD